MYSIKDSLGNFIENDDYLSRGELQALYAAYGQNPNFETDLKNAFSEYKLSSEQVIALNKADGSDLKNVWTALDTNGDKKVLIGETSTSVKKSASYLRASSTSIPQPTQMPALSDFIADSNDAVLDLNNFLSTTLKSALVNSSIQSLAKIMASMLGRSVGDEDYKALQNYIKNSFSNYLEITGKQFWDAIRKANGNVGLLEKSDIGAIIGNQAVSATVTPKNTDTTAVPRTVLPTDSEIGTDLQASLFKSLHHNRFKISDLSDPTTEVGYKFASLIANNVGRDITAGEFQNVARRLQRYFAGQEDITLNDVMLAIAEAGTTTGDKIDKADWEAVLTGNFAKGPSEAYLRNPLTMQISPLNSVPDLGDIVEKQDTINLADLYKAPTQDNPKAQKFAQFIATYLGRDITINEYFTIMNHVLNSFQGVTNVMGNNFWKFLSTASGMANIVEKSDFEAMINGTAHKSTSTLNLLKFERHLTL